MSEYKWEKGRVITYLYDASGNKLRMKSYAANGALKTTEYIGGFVYEDGALSFFGSPEGRVARTQDVENLITNPGASSTTGYPANQNVTVSAVTINGQTYVKGVCNQSTSTPGIYKINGVSIDVEAGSRYVLKVKGYASTTGCNLYVYSNVGNLVWLGKELPVGAANEGWVSNEFLVPAGAVQVNVGVLWSVPAVGREMHLNHVELRKIRQDYEYAIADHQGNTRVVFTSASATPVGPTATFEGDANDGMMEYQNVNMSNVVTSTAANHTTGGSKVVRMNQTYKIGPSKSLKVSPGDKIDLEVWEYHEGSSGFGTTSTPLSTMITMVAGAFGGISGGGGESGLIYNSVNSALSAFVPPGNQGANRPAAYLNYILFDQNFKVLNAGAQLAPATTFTKQKLSFGTINIKEPGYIFVYVSYDNASNNWVYFDDLKVTHTPTNVIQYNEYYPFGLQTENSWTRESNYNNFLFNGGSERNTTTGWYETFFRGYDATLGRFAQVDPLAINTAGLSPYHYSYCSPINFNDPWGLTPDPTWDDMMGILTFLIENGGGSWTRDEWDEAEGEGECPGCTVFGDSPTYEYAWDGNNVTLYVTSNNSTYSNFGNIGGETTVTVVNIDLSNRTADYGGWGVGEGFAHGCPPGIDCDYISRAANDGLKTVAFSADVVDTYYRLWQGNYDHVKYRTTRGAMKTMRKPDGTYRSARAARFGFYSKSAKGAGLGLSIINLGLSGYQLRQELTSGQPIDPMNATQFGVGAIGFSASFLNYVGIGGRLTASVSASAGALGLVLTIPGSWYNVYKGAYDLQYVSTPYYPSDSEVFGGY